MGRAGNVITKVLWCDPRSGASCTASDGDVCTGLQRSSSRLIRIVGAEDTRRPLVLIKHTTPSLSTRCRCGTDLLCRKLDGCFAGVPRRARSRPAARLPRRPSIFGHGRLHFIMGAGEKEVLRVLLALVWQEWLLRLHRFRAKTASNGR